jgi:beta-N-acetylglucosaminidase
METKQVPMDSKLAKKFETSKSIKVSFENSSAWMEFKKTKHKEGRMKVTLKFGKDEAEGFTNFCKLAKPENISQDDFVKFLFYKGVEALQQDFASRLDKYKQENPEEYAKLKAEFDATQSVQEGSVTIAEDKQ